MKGDLQTVDRMLMVTGEVDGRVPTPPSQGEIAETFEPRRFGGQDQHQ